METTQLIAKAIAGRARPRVASLASSTRGEIFDVLATRHAQMHFTAVDNNPEALAFVREKAARLDVTRHVTCVRDNVVRLVCGRSRGAMGPQDLIYCVGLVDYLEDDYVIVLLNWAHEHLTPGGTVLVGGERRLLHRSPDDLGRLFARSRFGGEGLEVFSENESLFAAARKR